MHLTTWSERSERDAASVSFSTFLFPFIRSIGSGRVCVCVWAKSSHAWNAFLPSNSKIEESLCAWELLGTETSFAGAYLCRHGQRSRLNVLLFRFFNFYFHFFLLTWAFCVNVSASIVQQTKIKWKKRYKRTSKMAKKKKKEEQADEQNKNGLQLHGIRWWCWCHRVFYLCISQHFSFSLVVLSIVFDDISFLPSLMTE